MWLTNFENMTGTQIAVVTVTSLEGRPIEEYANELYRAWGIGAKTGEHKDKGALLLVAVQDRKTRLEVGYGLEGDLPDGLAGEIIRRMRPELQQGQIFRGDDHWRQNPARHAGREMERQHRGH